MKSYIFSINFRHIILNVKKRAEIIISISKGVKIFYLLIEYKHFIKFLLQIFGYCKRISIFLTLQIWCPPNIL
jgi:hypothetical protein